MPDKPKEDDASNPKSAAKEAGPYGNRWGAGPASTPHNRPGSIASDPASAPRPQEAAHLPVGAGVEPEPPDDDAALREKREQGWDSEGGATSRTDR